MEHLLSGACDGATGECGKEWRASYQEHQSSERGEQIKVFSTVRDAAYV